jgi:hypothetical protein
MTKGESHLCTAFQGSYDGISLVGGTDTHKSDYSILGHRELVKQLAKQPNMGGVTTTYTPVLDSSEQRTLLP